MKGSNEPSIFTSKDSLNDRPLPPNPPPLHFLHNVRSSSPFRRPSSPLLPPQTAASGRSASATRDSVGAPSAASPSRRHSGLAAADTDRTPSIWNSFSRRSTSPRKESSRYTGTSREGFATPRAEQLSLLHDQPSTPTSRSKRKLGLDPTPVEHAPSPQPSRKRAKLRPRFKHSLNGSAFGPPDGLSVEGPSSPLFFSNSPRARPELPRFLSGEAAARATDMLSKAHSEEGHIKTVSLARGTVSSPAAGLGSTGAPSHRKSLERTITQRSSPDGGLHNVQEGHDGTSGILNSIGIVELLEQDERPTFIVDLGDSANYGSGPLHPVFSNSSLRSHEGMQASITGMTSREASRGSQTFLQFKSWLLSASVHGESLNVCLPPFTYLSMTWNCSTLRKRLRVISGTLDSTSSNSKSSSAAAFELSAPPSELLPRSTPAEPPDYFGATAPTKNVNATGAGRSGAPDIMPTIEAQQLDPEILRDAQQLTLLADIDLSGATQLLPSANTQIPVVSSDAPSFDWTRLPVSDTMPRHIQFARSIDWASTSLGPIENWCANLRQAVNLIMASPHPAAMYWGDDLIAIYNEAYILLAGQKHPSLMGTSYRVAWAEIWDEVKDVFANAKSTGEATMKDDDCLFIRRSDHLEECYFSWSIIPMVGSDGSVMGLYNPAFEKTRRKIAERRMLTLREIGERTATARDVKAFWSQVLGSFEFNEHDSPFLLLYSVTEDSDSDASSIQSGSNFSSRQCILEGALGLPEGHQAGPDHIDLRAGMEGFGPVFREVIKTDKPVLLEVGSRDLPASLVTGLEWRGFGDPVDAVVVCPIRPTTGENVLGFLVLGVNPRRPYDDDYSLFIQLLSRQLGTSLASVVLFEGEIRRGQRAAQLAALDRIELSEQLAQRTREAIDSETKFTRMAEFAPVGMFIANSEGKITFANDTWYDISRVPKNASMADTWTDAVKPEDLHIVQELWTELVINVKPVSKEFRFKAQWRDGNGESSDTWALFSGYPEQYPDGKLKSIFGSITDISQQKWAEGLQTRKMEEAVELKRQQENFIDITSHEMRNPLSAILQCADDIATSLTKFRHGGERTISDELLASCLDAAQTISLCSQHQKRIVDDILTLSKLDSALLLVTPVDAEPLTVVRRALKMHEGELQAADIQMKLVVHMSFRQLNLNWVRFDPSRVLQVLINLTTNAIKFTGTEDRRTITVTIGASVQRPSDQPDAPVKYFPTRKKDKDILPEHEWGTGEKVYIHFAVRDTGRGLSAEEKKLLFIRFSQASPRTHVQYGGSGLGLFISRELTELQGGEIGVESEAGEGSTFAFFVAARRSNRPVDTAHDASGVKRAPAQAVKAQSKAVPSPQGAHVQPAQGTGDDQVKSARPQVTKVLIVEDNLVNQKVLRKQLTNRGMEVHVANHGGEALDKLMQSTYWRDAASMTDRLEIGVVLMDQEMPVMDGLTATRKIREYEAQGKLTGHIPIIAVTANARSEQIAAALHAGMDDVVSKPFRIPDLVPKIDELLEQYPLP